MLQINKHAKLNNVGYYAFIKHKEVVNSSYHVNEINIKTNLLFIYIRVAP